jgi:hypothetical protein
MKRYVVRICVTLLCLSVAAVPASAQKGPESPETHCDPVFNTDVGSAIGVQPDGTWQTYSGDCTADGGCNDYFEITCSAGATLDLSFCSNGGTADWDTGLSIWSADGSVMEDCNDDSCSLQSELSWVFPADMTVWMRVGGFGDASGAYTLAYSAPADCVISGAPVPTMNGATLAALMLVLLVVGAIFVGRHRRTV